MYTLVDYNYCQHVFQSFCLFVLTQTYLTVSLHQSGHLIDTF